MVRLQWCGLLRYRVCLMAVDLDPRPPSVVASVRRRADGAESADDWDDVAGGVSAAVCSAPVVMLARAAGAFGSVVAGEVTGLFEGGVDHGRVVGCAAADRAGDEAARSATDNSHVIHPPFRRPRARESLGSEPR